MLRERYERCLAQEAESLGAESALTRAWILSQPQLASILAEATRAEPDLVVDGWHPASKAVLVWPSRTEGGRATLAWTILNALADNPHNSQLVTNYGRRLTSSTDPAEIAHAIVRRIYGPLFDYLRDRVAANSRTLYTLARFVRYVEWFARESLYSAYECDTVRGEWVYDRSLRKFLFNEGINTPYSQSKGPSGASDILSALDSDDPLVCELKLFTGASRAVAQGVNQALLYAQDHGVSTAYLVIINLTDRSLEVPTDGSADNAPRYIDLAGVRIYLLPVRALPPANSASKAGKAKPFTLKRADVTRTD